MPSIDGLDSTNVYQLKPGDSFTIHEWRTPSGRMRLSPRTKGPYRCTKVLLGPGQRDGRRFWEVTVPNFRGWRRRVSYSDTVFLVAHREASRE